MKIRFCLISGFILQFTLFSQVNWQSKGPAPQIDLNSVYFINTNTGLVCGVGGFVYKTTDAGFSWISKTTPTTRNLNSMWFYSPTGGLAVGDTGTVIFTTNTGESWSLQSPVTTFDLRKIFFYDNLNTFVICSSGRILKSTNSGSNWSLINLNVPDLFEIDKSNNSILIGSTTGKYLRTTDVGLNWQLINPGISTSNAFHIHFSTVDTGYIYFGISSGVYMTVNGGQNWTPFTNNSSITKANYLNSYRGFSQSLSGEICRTTNGGFSWSTFGPSNIQYSSIFNLYILDTSNIYITGTGGKILHHDASSNPLWDIIGGSVNSCYDMSFFNNNNGIIAANEEQVWTTTSGGNKWTIRGLCNNNYFESPRTFIRSVYYKDSLTIYYTRGDGYAGHGFTGSIGVSYNGGVTWSTSLSQISSEFYKIGGAGNSVLCCTGKIIKNSGSGWSDYLVQSGTGFFDFNFINENTGIILGNTYSGNIRKIFSTTNNGTNWNEQQSPVLALNVTMRNSGICLISCDSGRVLRSTNFGLNWTQYNTPTIRNLYSVYMISDNTAWAVGSQGVMLYSNNSGLNWSLAPSYTTRNLNEITFTDQNTGYVSGDYGTVFKTTDGGLTFTNSGINEIPDSYMLQQNFPNPFNPATRVMFSVPVKGNVKVEIYDVSGKLVDVLIDKEYTPGSYSVDWNAINYSSGIYFYKMTSGEFVESKKMILLK
ncbi:MAG: YCF48-related protein [Ignavibacteria bacterium]